MIKLRFGTAGVTLTELMVVVAIIAILAAVAIPVFVTYMRKSKAAEAATLLQGIREKQEAFFAEFKRYSDDIGFTPYAEGDASDSAICGSNHHWALAADSPWLRLGFVPDGPTYYTYSVETAFEDGALITDFPATTGTAWPGALAPWYRGIAVGDVDCNGDVARFYITSHNHSVIKVNNATEAIDENVY